MGLAITANTLKDASVITNHDHPASNTAAVVTIAAVTGKSLPVTLIDFGYDGTPTGGYLLVTSGGTTIYKVPVTSGGAGPLRFPGGLFGRNSAGQPEETKAIVITLAAGGSGVTGYLNTQHAEM